MRPKVSEDRHSVLPFLMICCCLRLRQSLGFLVKMDPLMGSPLSDSVFMRCFVGPGDSECFLLRLHLRKPGRRIGMN